MRRMSILMFSITLAAFSQGCGKTIRHTSGVCDCYPPPVNTLLQAPCPKPGHPGSPVSGAYAPAPYAAYGSNQAAVIQVQPAPAAVAAQPMPTTANPTPPVLAPKVNESIRVLPKIEEDKKDK